MGKFRVILTKKVATKRGLRASLEPKGLFLWVGGANAVDWTAGYHKKRGFEATRHYGDWTFWKALWRAIIDKDGFVTLTRFL